MKTLEQHILEKLKINTDNIKRQNSFSITFGDLACWYADVINLNRLSPEDLERTGFADDLCEDRFGYNWERFLEFIKENSSSIVDVTYKFSSNIFILQCNLDVNLKVKPKFEISSHTLPDKDYYMS